MTTKYVVAPCEPTHVMAMAANDAFPTMGETTCSQIGQQIYTAMLAAIPDDPSAPVLVDRDELKRLRKDAERYRWLREQPNNTEAPRIDVVRWVDAGDVNDGEGIRTEELDTAIDAAIVQEKQE